MPTTSEVWDIRLQGFQLLNVQGQGVGFRAWKGLGPSRIWLEEGFTSREQIKRSTSVGTWPYPTVVSGSSRPNYMRAVVQTPMQAISRALM